MFKRLAVAPLYLLAGLAAIVAFGCVPPPTEPDGGINVCGGAGSCGGTFNPGQPSPSPTASPLPGCPAVASVTVGFSGAGGRTSTRVGAGEVLDVTPRDASRNEVPAHCHGQTVQWSLSGSSVCQLSGDTAGFNPHVTCSTPGSFAATATVAAPGGTGSTVFTVAP